ncbi:M50 family metallopeptidase [Gemmata sp. JC673]|uniref:M50 family metallopeptidase n=1 Tax=Gemmata algarum TaxID=2975278 RepID=A0ABU5EQS7_9BACT|nr:M50 family metallopeptidase [Gemmata algarum]MDY3557703.1 M50 family metallopeptidase [Gemmata algarum]
MFSSLKLGKVFGIDLYVHGTFWLLPLLVLFSGLDSSVGELVFELLFVFAVFGCVALHELGHALAAAAYGIRTRDITLYPVGGVASLERMPERPGREIAVALAGPAVNVIIALGLFIALVVGDSAFELSSVSGGDVIGAFLGRLLIANVFLTAFNLLPAFPMDGGRVLRALLSTQMPRVRATETAVGVGTVMAVLFGVAGLLLPKLSLLAVAVVVWMLGQAELAHVRAEGRRRRIERQERDFFSEPAQASADDDLADRRFTGLAWNTTYGVWVQWVNGVPVRALPR